MKGLNGSTLKIEMLRKIETLRSSIQLHEENHSSSSAQFGRNFQSMKNPPILNYSLLHFTQRKTFRNTLTVDKPTCFNKLDLTNLKNDVNTINEYYAKLGRNCTDLNQE